LVLQSESFALRATLALAIAGQLFIILGIAGALHPIVYLAVALIAAVVLRPTRLRWELLVAALPLIALALYPPIAFDETLYHLPTVQAIARSGAIRFFGELRFPVFPILHEALCVPVFLAFGDVATHLVSVLEILLLAGIVLKWRSGGLLAAALIIGHPIVMQIGSVTYADAALMLFVTAGFYCLDRERFAMAGFLLGTACSVKYLGGYFALAGLLFAWRNVPRYLLGLAAGVVPMFGFITWQTGNPVFPFFGSTVWTHHMPPPNGNVWRAFWDMTFDRARLNWQPPYSPLFAISLLITFVAGRFDRRAAFISALCIIYVGIFAFLPQDSRYLLPLLPLVSVVAATAIAPRLKHVGLIALIVALPGFAYAGYRVMKQGLPPRSATERRVYLEQHIPEFRALEHRGRGPIYVCGAEQLKYYGGDELRGDVVGPYTSMPANTRYMLISRRKCPPPPGFTRIYADEAAELWEASR